MRRVLIAVTFIVVFAATRIDAQPPVPGYYRVTGVASDDVLNVRAGPTVASARLAALALTAQPIEVVEVSAPRGAPWGRIAVGEASGWVSMRYLEPVELEGVLGSAVPVQASCGGTEPFWGLNFEREAAVFDDPFADTREARLPIESARPASGRFYPVLLSFADNRGHAVLDRAVCSDGMSDIPHGWSLQLILRSEDERLVEREPRFLSGCCRVVPHEPPFSISAE